MSPGNKARRAFVLPGLALVLVAAAAAVGVPGRMDTAFYDTYSLIKLTKFKSDARGLPVVIAIDGPALRTYGRWPWPRTTLAALVRRVQAGRPSVVGIDLLLAEPSPGDERLAAVLAGGPSILAERLALKRTGKLMRRGNGDEPNRALAAAASGRGFIDFFPDADGVARRMLTRFGHGERKRLSLAAALAKAAGRLRDGGEVTDLCLGITPAAWPTISAGDVLAGRADPLRWRGRPVLIGLTAPGVSGDSYPVAVRALGRIPGVYLHAYAYATLSRWHGRRNLPLGIALLLTLGAAVIPAFLNSAGPWRMAAVLLAACVAITLASLGLFLSGWWWPPALALLAATISTGAQLIDQAAADRRRVRRLRSSFGKFVSPEALRRILAGPEPALGGEERDISVLFADLRGFSALAEGRPPHIVAAQLNAHLALMSREIQATGGMVDKFVGDAVMGLFGAPAAVPDHRQRALDAACRIKEALARPGLLPVGIGVASGIALVGNIGSPERLEYTAIGDPVNLAARLEEMAGCNEIYASAECFAGADPGPGWESLGEMQLRGRIAKSNVYRLKT